MLVNFYKKKVKRKRIHYFKQQLYNSRKMLPKNRQPLLTTIGNCCTVDLSNGCAVRVNYYYCYLLLVQTFFMFDLKNYNNTCNLINLLIIIEILNVLFFRIHTIHLIIKNKFQFVRREKKWIETINSNRTIWCDIKLNLHTLFIASFYDSNRMKRLLGRLLLFLIVLTD